MHSLFLSNCLSLSLLLTEPFPHLPSFWQAKVTRQVPSHTTCPCWFLSKLFDFFDSGLLPTTSRLWHCNFLRLDYSLLFTCQHSSSLYWPLPFLSILTISPFLLHSTKRSLSHAYGHIQTSTITNFQTLLFQVPHPLGGWYINFMLTTIAKNHTRWFFHS